MKTHLTLSQRIHNAEGSQAAEYLHARHSYLHAKAFGLEEWGQFWDTSEEASWGHSFGVMCGFDEVWYNSVTNYDPQGFQGYIANAEADPNLSWFDARAMREVAMHTLATDVIEVADDGKTARACFLTPGLLFNCLGSQNFFGLTLWERYGSDFIYDEEQDRWLYLHEQVCPDMGGPSDIANPGMSAYQKLMGPTAGGPGGPGGGPGGPGGAPGGPGGPGGAPGGPGGPGGAPGGGPGGPGGAPGGGHGQQAWEGPGSGPTRGGTGAGGSKGNTIISLKGTTHFNYTPMMHVQNTVPWPEPYKTMDKENTYRIYEIPKY